jgi:hypothetical protein
LTIAGVWFLLLWVGVHILRMWSSPLGPGTDVASAGLPASNVVELLTRVSWSASAVLPRFADLLTQHLGILFGTGRHFVVELGIESRVAAQGWTGASYFFCGALLLAAVRTAYVWHRTGRCKRQVQFAAFLTATGLLSVLALVLVGREPIDAARLRYDLLGLLLVVGTAATFFAVENNRACRVAAVATLAAWTSLSAYSNARLLTEYVVNPPPADARVAAQALVSRGIQHARGSYAVAYRLTFLSGERVKIAATTPVRILEYGRQMPQGAPLVAEHPCQDGVLLAGDFHLCSQDE